MDEIWASDEQIEEWCVLMFTLHEMTIANKAATGWLPTRLQVLDKLRGLGWAAPYDHGAHRKP